METSYASLPDIVIAAGQQYSQVFNGVYIYHDAVQIDMYGTGAYAAEAFAIEINQKQDATNSDTGWVSAVAIDNTTVLTPPAAGLSKHFGQELTGSGSFRIKCTGGNVAAERRWKANKLWSWMGEK
jgi:hypothetical protein